MIDRFHFESPDETFLDSSVEFLPEDLQGVSLGVRDAVEALIWIERVFDLFLTIYADEGNHLDDSSKRRRRFRNDAIRQMSRFFGRDLSGYKIDNLPKIVHRLVRSRVRNVCEPTIDDLAEIFPRFFNYTKC